MHAEIGGSELRCYSRMMPPGRRRSAGGGSRWTLRASCEQRGSCSHFRAAPQTPHRRPPRVRSSHFSVHFRSRRANRDLVRSGALWHALVCCPQNVCVKNRVRGVPGPAAARRTPAVVCD
eukprot:5457115-Prymnesium_polylepis.2